MASVSLAALVTGARLVADRRPGGEDAFVTDTEATSMAHRSLARLRGILTLAAGHEQWTSTSTITLSAGTTDYSLPSDYSATVAVRVRYSSTDVEDVRAYETREEPALRSAGSGWVRGAPKGYRVGGSALTLQPPPTAAHTVEHVYVQRYDTSTTTTDLGVDGWDEWVMLDVACQMLRTGREPHGDIAEDRDSLGDQLREMVRYRAPDPIRVVDVEPDRRAPWWPQSRSV